MRRRRNRVVADGSERRREALLQRRRRWAKARITSWVYVEPINLHDLLFGSYKGYRSDEPFRFSDDLPKTGENLEGPARLMIRCLAAEERSLEEHMRAYTSDVERQIMDAFTRLMLTGDAQIKRPTGDQS